MPYTLLPAEETEKPLFFRLDGEAAERRGALGYLRADFGKTGQEFWTTWFDGQKHLKTHTFKTEFNKVVDSLRNDGERPPFANRYALAAFCATTPGTALPAGRGKGFVLRTLDYSYYARCNPQYGDYDIGLYAFDNRWLLPELAGKHELPEKCFSVLPRGGEIILITRGENPYTPFASDRATPTETRIAIDDLNGAMGVTRAQEEAMLAGLLQGWDTPAAKPWNYDRAGNPRQALHKKKDEPER
jgi:hypothetical protein